MAQDSKRHDEIEVPFVFVPDDTEEPAVRPSGDTIRLRAQLVPAAAPRHRDPAAPSDQRAPRRPPHRSSD